MALRDGLFAHYSLTFSSLSEAIRRTSARMHRWQGEHSGLKMPSRRWATLYFLTCSVTALATAPAVAQKSSWPVEMPVLDVPFNTDSATIFPSMAQSLALTKGFYLLSHTKIQASLAESPRTAAFALLGFDLLSLWLPLGSGWMHEEWHRAVLGVAGIDSHNGIYNFEFSDVVKITGVTDYQLVAHKAEHPADQVRLNSAGIEAQYELNLALERSVFFHDTPAWITPVLWLNTANNIGYLHTCATDKANTLTAEIIAQEDADTDERDFTGLDCTAWVYDLLRPAEPYAARGIHPSGVGIDRYRNLNDLSPDEQRYVRRQRNLSLVNLADPFLFGRKHFAARHPASGTTVLWNANLRHHLTPFGYNLGANVFLRSGGINVLATVQGYANDAGWGPGLDVTVQRHTFDKLLPQWRMTTRVAAWQQPAALAYRTGEFDTGALAAVTLEHGHHALRPFVQVEYKSEGWIAGNEYLGENWALRMGVTWWNRIGRETKSFASETHQ